jgi:hypothetical protein
MKKHFFISALFSCFTLASCTKDNGVHVNKFTCKVNGVFWEAIPRERDILGNDLQMSVSPTLFGSIHARNVKKEQSITFNLSLNDTSKDFIITDSNPFADYTRNCNVYRLDTLSPRIVIVTEHDKEKQIIKGTFTFRAINSSVGCLDSANVTDGFFDMQY